MLWDEESRDVFSRGVFSVDPKTARVDTLASVEGVNELHDVPLLVVGVGEATDSDNRIGDRYEITEPIGGSLLTTTARSVRVA